MADDGEWHTVGGAPVKKAPVKRKGGEQPRRKRENKEAQPAAENAAPAPAPAAVNSTAEAGNAVVEPAQPGIARWRVQAALVKGEPAPEAAAPQPATEQRDTAKSQQSAAKSASNGEFKACLSACCICRIAYLSFDEKGVIRMYALESSTLTARYRVSSICRASQGEGDRQQPHCI
jgi:hypothetical protein